MDVIGGGGNGFIYQPCNYDDEIQQQNYNFWQHPVLKFKKELKIIVLPIAKILLLYSQYPEEENM